MFKKPLDMPQGEKPEDKELHYAHWFSVMDKIMEREKPDYPIAKKAMIALDVMGIPAGEAAAVGPAGKLREGDKPGAFATSKDEFQAGTKNERVIWEKLAGHPGIRLDENIVSIDPRDTVFQDGKIPADLKKALGKNASAILAAKIGEQQRILREYGNTENIIYEADMPIVFYKLPGGSNIFSVGYIHDQEWHSKHEKHLVEMSRHASILAIEGYEEMPYGESLLLRWKRETGHYDALMRSAVSAGFDGSFVEIEPRGNRGEIEIDHTDNYNFPNLPDKFLIAYAAYLEKEDPELFDDIRKSGGLNNALFAQSTTSEGLVGRAKSKIQNGIRHYADSYFTPKGKTSYAPTGLEIGEKLFSDAVCAIRLHMMAKLQGEGKLPKGPILDFEGAAHLLSKDFFIRYPLYAMEVILRNPHFALIHTLGEDEDIEDVARLFENPDLEEIIRNLGKLPFHEVEDDPKRTIETGLNQKRLIDQTMNFWDGREAELREAARKMQAVNNPT